jgi:protein ImuB
MAFACIHVPDFAVEAILRTEPELRAQALAILPGKPPLVRVFAVNAKANAAGIEPGMTKSQAEICPSVVLRQRSALQEDAAHAALLDCAQSFSPCVEDTATDTLVLDLIGLESLFGPLPKIARDLARRASDLGLEANVAVASNPDSAVLVACGFPGVTVIPSGEEASRLGELPIDVLSRLPGHPDDTEPMLETLNRWGVRTLRALAALPEITVSERLGQKGAYLQKLTRGATRRTLVAVEAPLKFEEVAEMEHPIMLLEPLAFLLNRMLEQLCERLMARALAAQELRLQLELDTSCREEWENSPKSLVEASFESAELALGLDGRGRPSPHGRPSPQEHASSQNLFQRSIRLPVPMLDARIFLKLLQLDLQAHPPGAPIKKIWLAADPARPRPGQAGLFLPVSPQPEKLELTLARIAGIVGEGNVGSPAMLDTHRPEGFRIERFAPPTPKVQTESNSENIAPVTALRMFRPALPATVTVRAGQPGRVECSPRSRIRGEVIWMAGPWRLTGDWWDQQPWARDEWDVAIQNENGLVLYRLVHDLFNGRWLVEGTYD